MPRVDRVSTIEEAHEKGSPFDDLGAMTEAGIDSDPATVATGPRVAACDESKPAGQRDTKAKESCLEPCWLCMETTRLGCWQS